MQVARAQPALVDKAGTPGESGTPRAKTMKPKNTPDAARTGGRGGHPGRVGQAQGGHARAGLHQEAICMAVVAPDELQHLCAAAHRDILVGILRVLGF